MPVDVNQWLDDGAKGTRMQNGRILVKREQLTDPSGVPLLIQLSVAKVTTANWSYTFYLETKEGADAMVQQGSWVMNKTNSKGARRTLLVQQIESAWDAQEERLGLVDRAPPEATSTTIREETHEGYTFRLDEVENAFGETGTIWLLFRSGHGENAAPETFRSEAEAQAGFDEEVRWRTTDVSSQTTHRYKEFAVIRQVTYENRKMQDVPKSVTYFFTETPPGSSIGGDYSVGDMVGQFGPLDGDEEHDFGVFDAYIDDVTTPDEEPTSTFEWVPVPFTGWEDAFSMSDTPFSGASKITDADVAGDKVEMYKDTGVFGFGDKYSNIYLYVKEGFKVKFNFDAQDLGGGGLFRDEDVDIDVTLYGGDSFVCDMTTRNAPTVLSIIIDGVESTPYTPEAEGFLGVTSERATVTLENIWQRQLVTPDEDVPEGRVTDPDDEQTDVDPTTFGGLGMVAVAGVVLLLFIGVLARVGKKAAGGGEEATE